MEDARTQDEFERIKLHQDVERHRLVLEQYENGMRFYRQEIENKRYTIGRLDERLGDGS